MNGSLASSNYFPTQNCVWPWINLPIYPFLDEKPLDLSFKLTNLEPIQTRSSVIQSTKDYQVPESSQAYLPTCSPPEISLSPSKKSTSSDPSPNRMSYPREFKLMVIDYFYANGHNKYRTCKEFQITKSMLNGWLTKAEKIRQSRPGALKSGRSGRKPQFPVVEKQLFKLYSEKVNSGEKVGNRWLRETARTLAANQCSSKELNGMCQFSERWLSNFKRRFGIGLKSENVETKSLFSADESQKALKSEEEDGLSICSDSSVGSSTAQMAKAVLHQTGQLPIQAFYEKFPWLCKRLHHPDDDEQRQPRGRKVQFPEVERKLFEIIKDDPSQFSNKFLQEKAREIAKDLQINDDHGKNAIFSEHWILNFKKRFNLVPKNPENPI